MKTYKKPAVSRPPPISTAIIIPAKPPLDSVTFPLEEEEEDVGTTPVGENVGLVDVAEMPIHVA